MANAASEDHAVFMDFGTLRLTCQTDECRVANNGVEPTIIHYGWMTPDQWSKAIADFRKEHPFTTAKTYERP